LSARADIAQATTVPVRGETTLEAGFQTIHFCSGGRPSAVKAGKDKFTAEGETNVRAGTQYKVTTESRSVNIRVRELDAGSWVMFRLPGFTTAAAGSRQDSLEALRQASKTSWFKADDALWVKMVSTGDIPGSGTGTTESLQVGR
jgi:hypothetical protein